MSFADSGMGSGSGAGDRGGAAVTDGRGGLSLAAVFVWMAVCFLGVAVPLLAPDMSALAAAYLDPRRVNEAFWGVLACAAILIVPPLVHGADPLRYGWRAAAVRAGVHAVALAGIAMPFGLIATRYFPLQRYAYLACLLFVAAVMFASLSACALAPSACHAASCAAAGGMPLAAYLLWEFGTLDRGGAAAPAVGRAVSVLLDYSPVSGAVRPLAATAPLGAWNILGPPAVYLFAGAVFILALRLADHSRGRRSPDAW
ncbi:MAG: hypothetical protein N3A38_10505 [Planctomycetota bacterium]|nr:hypothetical protein [Planctomycetota bacterium]